MVKLLWRFGLLVAATIVFAWLADRPGQITINWLGREIHLSVLVGVALLSLALLSVYFVWQVITKIWRGPSAAREHWRFRKHRKAYDSLSRGIIAAGAGDAHSAAKHAAIAGDTLKNEPLVTLLAAQAAQLKGDRAAVKRAFEDMTKAPDTEVLGLRGLFAEAKQAGDWATARSIAERALSKNSRLPWASAAILQVQITAKDWAAAAATIANQAKAGLMARDEAAKKQAALLAAQALADEDTNPQLALDNAQQAHKLDGTLVPAALVAARCQIAAGNSRKAIKLLQNCWAKSPHPELVQVYCNAKPTENAEDRFERVRDLVGSTDNTVEGACAVARAAINAKRFEVAKATLAPFLEDQPQARMCGLMAEIEDAQGDKGRSREWLARALHAPRDPIWVSDGVASARWTPVSPVTGEIVPCEWKPPFEMAAGTHWQLNSNEDVPLLETASVEDAKPVEVARLPDDPGVE